MKTSGTAMRICAAMVCALLLATGTSARASTQSPEEIVGHALAQVDWNPGRSWAYTRTGFEDETLMVSRFDPSRAEGQRWTLLAVDNRPPTIEEIEAFLDEKRDEQAIPDDDGDLSRMIEFESLSLSQEDEDRWLFSFEPILDGDNASFAERMQGELSISKSNGALQYVDVRNTESIRPFIGVKIKTLHMRFDFAPASNNGPQVLSEVTAVVRGGAYLLVSIDEEELTRFSDFEFVGDAAGQRPANAPD